MNLLRQVGVLYTVYMSSHPFLKSENLILRPLSLEDLDGPYVSWLNDPEVCKYNSHGVVEYTRAMGKEYIERVSRDEHTLVLAIIAKDANVHIGNISLQKIDTDSRSAEYAILLGDTAYWGRGVATEASKLLLTHGFTALNLHRIYCGTSVSNIAMQKLAARLGFTEEGRRREAHFKNGVYEDIIEYGLLVSDSAV